MATGRTPDASETRRAEDSKVTGYDKSGKARTFRTDELRGGRLPEGYSEEPPEGAHPNVKASGNASAQSSHSAAREAALDRRERELAERESKLGKPK